LSQLVEHQKELGARQSHLEEALAAVIESRQQAVDYSNPPVSPDTMPPAR
jgi:hypothetical protein